MNLLRFGTGCAASGAAAALLGCAPVAYQPGSYDRVPVGPAARAPAESPRGAPALLGTVEVNGPNAYVDGRSVTSGTPVYDGNEVSTGPGTSLTVVLQQGGTIQLDENTDPRLLMRGACLLVRMVHGQALFNASRLCAEDDNLSLVLNSTLNLSSAAGQSTATLLNGHVTMERPVRAQMAPYEQYTSTRGAWTRRQLSQREAYATAAWTQRYLQPRPSGGRMPPRDVPEPASPPDRGAPPPYYGPVQPPPPYGTAPFPAVPGEPSTVRPPGGGAGQAPGIPPSAPQGGTPYTPSGPGLQGGVLHAPRPVTTPERSLGTSPAGREAPAVTPTHRFDELRRVAPPPPPSPIR